MTQQTHKTNSSRPTTVAPVRPSQIWTLLGSYVQSLTGSSRLPAPSRVDSIVSLLGCVS